MEKPRIRESVAKDGHVGIFLENILYIEGEREREIKISIKLTTSYCSFSRYFPQCTLSVSMLGKFNVRLYECLH